MCNVHHRILDIRSERFALVKAHCAGELYELYCVDELYELKRGKLADARDGRAYVERLGNQLHRRKKPHRVGVWRGTKS